MVDMKNKIHIPIWEHCDPAVSAAIRQFEERWQPYSQSSQRYPIVGLIKDVIDPAVAAYVRNFPEGFTGFIPGALPGFAFSKIIRLVGLEAMLREQRQLLRQFIMTEDQQTARDQSFVATLESLIELVWACMCKRPQSSSAEKGVNLNDQRRHGYCEHCGQLTEFAAFMSTVADKRVNDAELEEQKKLELSDKYCAGHKPKLATGEWNPAYRQAKRSLTQFNIELARLTRQCAKRSEASAKSGDKLIDEYFYHFMLNLTIQPADHAELRNIARRMVDSKLSDTKKKMLALQKIGFNQSEIGQRLLNANHQPMTRQAVSKALSNIRSEFIVNRPQ